MSFEVKNIEQENIDHKIIAPLTGFVVITIIASMIFVYYYFIFEKDSVMQEQYLEAESKILKNHTSEEGRKYELLKMDGEDGKINKTIQIYSTKKTIEQRLGEIETLEEQLLSKAFAELVKRGEKDKRENRTSIRGVQAFYPSEEIKKIQLIVEDPNWTYEESGQIRDGLWGKDSKYAWIEWKKRRVNK